jgi:hypothetical protein
MAATVDKEFGRLLTAALSTAGKATTQLEPRVNQIRAFIAAQQNLPAYEAMLFVYLRDYQALEKRNDKNAAYISAAIFVDIFDLRIQLATFFDPHLQDWLQVFVDNSPAAPNDEIYQRFKSLNSVQQSAIVNRLRQKRAEKRDNLAIFEILADLFNIKHRRLPETDEEMFGRFSPMPERDLHKKLTESRAAAKHAFASREPEQLQTVIRDFASWASEGFNVARSFQIFIWCRDIVLGHASSPHTTDAWIDNEIYLVSVQRVVIAAINSGHGYVIRNFLSEDDIETFLEPLAASRYYSSYADRLYPFFGNGPYSAGANFVDLVLLQLNLLLFADALGFFLASPQEMDDVLNDLILNGAEIRNRRGRISAPSMAQLSRTIRVGQEIEGLLTVVHFEDYASSTVTIVWKGIDHFVFFAPSEALGHLVERHLFQKLYENTKHLLVLIPAFFELLQYIAAFLTGGVLGLVEEFVENMVGEAAVAIAERYTDNEALLMLAGGINPASLAFPGRRFGKAAIKAGVKAVRKIKTLKPKPKSSIPRARARFKKPKKPAKPPKVPVKKQPKAKKQKSKRPDKYYRARIYNFQGAFESKPAKRLSKTTGLKRKPLTESQQKTTAGMYQMAVSGGKESGYWAQLKNGRVVEPDGLAHSVDSAGKVDLIEAKDESELIDHDNFDVKSHHFRQAEEKREQMERYARYAKENPGQVDKVRYICSSRTVYDTYYVIVREQLLPKHLRKYIEIELDPRAL